MEDKSKATRKIPMACLLAPEEDDDGIFDPYRHMEIVGLFCSDNGRSCKQHECCRHHVRVGDILCLKRTLVDNAQDGTTEEAFCCVKIEDATEKCRVAFVPQFLMSSPVVTKNVNKCLQVVELFLDATNLSKKQKSKTCGGVAGVIFVDEVPALE